MAVRPFDEIFRDFVVNGLPASGPHHPEKKDIRDSLNALVAGPFPDNRVIKLNNANEGTENNIVVSASVAIPTAVYQVLYILNVTQENTGPVTVSGAINRKLVTNTNEPVPAGYLKPGMAVLCVDTGSELRMLSYGDVESAVEDLTLRAEAAEAAAELAKDQAQNAASDAVSQGNVPIYSTRDAIETLEIPIGINAFRTNGFASVGDGGAALYKRVASEPTHAGKVQSADGAWWELVGDQQRVNTFSIGTSYEDNTLAIQRAVDYAMENGGGVQLPSDVELVISEPIIVKPTKALVLGSKASDIHFANARPLRLFGNGRHTIKASPNFSGGEMIRLTYGTTVTAIAPQWTVIDNLVLDGSEHSIVGIMSDYCMNTRFRDIGIKDTSVGISFIGYGVSDISRNTFRCATKGIDVSQGGGDSWIERNDFFCPGWGVDVGQFGGNLKVGRNVFNRQDADVSTSDRPIAVRISGASGMTRSVKVVQNEFCGMDFGVYAVGTEANKVAQLLVADNHTIPSAGGYLKNNNIVHLDYATGCIIRDNMSGSEAFGGSGTVSPRIPVSIVRSANSIVSGNVIYGSRKAAIEAELCESISIIGNNLMDTGIDAPYENTISIISTKNSFIDGNVARQNSAGYAQNFLVEIGTSTDNHGRNIAHGYTTVHTLAPGSTSSYT